MGIIAGHRTACAKATRSEIGCKYYNKKLQEPGGGLKHYQRDKADQSIAGRRVEITEGQLVSEDHTKHWPQK